MKKTIKAPLTHNPGKGRPKEHLAYLNWQEMQALKRLNGKKPEKGPKGLPSFAAFAGTTGTGYASAANSTSTASKTSTSKSSGPSSSLSSPVRTAPSSAAGRTTASKSAPASRLSTSLGTTSRSAAGNSGGAGGATTGTASKPSTAATGASNKDTAAAQAAASKSTSKAANNPAVKGDISKAVSGGTKLSDITGTNPPGGSIKGAIKSVQETAAQAAARRVGPFAPTPQQYKTAQAMERAMLQDLKTNKIDPAGRGRVVSSIERLGEMGRVIQGEAAFESPFGQAAVGNTMFNRIDAYNKAGERLAYKGGDDFDSLMAQYDANGIRVPSTITGSYKAAVPGTEEYRKGIIALNQALGPNSYFNENASAKLKNATNYYNPSVPGGKPDWAKKSDVKVGSHYFGTAENIGKTVADARKSAMASINPAGFDKRPQGSLVVAETPAPAQPATLMSTGTQKQIYDRLVNFTNPDGTKTTAPVGKVYESLVGSGVEPEQAARIANEMINAPGNDYNVRGPARTPERVVGVENFIDPATTINRNPFDTGRATPRMRSAIEAASALPSAARTPSVPRMSGATSMASLFSPGVRTPSPPTMRGATSIASGFPAAAITPSPSSMRAAIDIASQLPAGVRTPEVGSMRSSTEMASSFPPGVRTPSPPTMRSAIEGMPRAPSYSAIPSPIEMGMLPSEPPAPFRSATAAAAALPGYATTPSPAAVRGATAFASSAYNPETQMFNEVRGEFDRVNDNLASKQETGIKALNDQITSYLTPSAGMLKTLADNSKLISTANTALNSGFKFAQNAVKTKVNELATDLYKQYVPDANKAAWENVEAGVASLTNMLNRGISVGLNLEGSLEGAQTVERAEGEKLTLMPSVGGGYKLRDITGTNPPGGKLITDRVPQETPAQAEVLARVKNVFKRTPSQLGPALQRQIAYAGDKIAKSRGLPGSGVPEENNMDEFSNSLIGEEASNAAKAAGFQRNVYTNPDFLSDPSQLGLMRENITDISPADMAKLSNRSRSIIANEKYGQDDIEPLLLGGEGTRSFVTNMIERGSRGLGKGIGYLMGNEGSEQFLSRPSYEQRELYNYANEANARYGRSPARGKVGVAGDNGAFPTFGGGGGYGGGDVGGGRDPTSFGGSGNYGSSDPSNDNNTGTPETAKSGARPDIYYLWDLGVNIPSPGDPSYTMYMTYMAERTAAAGALYT